MLVHILWPTLCTSSLLARDFILTNQAHEKNKTHIEALPNPSYPLYPTGDSAEVPESQSITDAPLEQR